MDNRNESLETAPQLQISDPQIAEKWLELGFITSIEEIYTRLTPEQEIARLENIQQLETRMRRIQRDEDDLR